MSFSVNRNLEKKGDETTQKSGCKENKWSGLDKGKNYSLVNIGRPGVFLLPTIKLKQKINGKSIEDDLHDWLTDNFGAYSSSLISNFGFWRNRKKRLVYDECREYEVSFDGKERIPVLLSKVAEIAQLIGEDCIYVKAGQYAGLLYPKARKK